MNVVVQKFGAKVFTDGLRHAMKLPYQEFEDQRSGETLSVLQKVRTDTERLSDWYFPRPASSVSAQSVDPLYHIPVYDNYFCAISGN